MALYNGKQSNSSLPDERQLEKLLNGTHILFRPPIKQNNGDETSTIKSKSETSIPGLQGLNGIQSAKANVRRRLTAVNLGNESTMEVQLKKQSFHRFRKILPEKLPLLSSLLNEISEANKGNLTEMFINQHFAQVRDSRDSVMSCSKDFWETPQNYRSSTHNSSEVQQSETEISLMPFYCQPDDKPEQRDNQRHPSLNHFDNSSLLNGTAINDSELHSHFSGRSYDMHKSSNTTIIAKNKKTLSDTFSESSEAILCASEGKLKLSSLMLPLNYGRNTASKLGNVSNSDNDVEHSSAFVTPMNCTGENAKNCDEYLNMPETLQCYLSPALGDSEGEWPGNKPKAGFIAGNDIAAPRQSHYELNNLIPVVHITFSEQEHLRKPLTSTEAKMKNYDNDLVCNFDHSFNIFAKKRPPGIAKKTRPKSKSAMTLKRHKVSQGVCLSTEISATQNTKSQAVSIKDSSKHSVLPLLTSHNAVKKLPEKKPSGETKPSTKNNEKNKKQGLLAVHRDEINHSKLKSPTSAETVQSNSDFLNLSHCDMFEKFTSEKKGPEICEMFTTSPYIQPREPVLHEHKSPRDTGSAPPLRSLPKRTQKSSNKLVRNNSNELVGNKIKRPKSQTSAKGKKTPGNIRSTLHKHTKHDLLDCENRNNIAIISGPDWYIKTPKTEIVFNEMESRKNNSLGLFDERQSMRLQEFNNNNWDLSVIREATIEESSASIRNLKETRKNREINYEPISSLSYSQHLNPSSEGLMRNIAEDHHFPQSLFNQSKEKNTQIYIDHLMDCVPCQNSGAIPQVSKSEKEDEIHLSSNKKCQEDNTSANLSITLKLNTWISGKEDSVSQDNEKTPEYISQCVGTDNLLNCLADELNLLDENDSMALSSLLEEHQNSSFKENMLGTRRAHNADKQCKCEEKEHNTKQICKSPVRHAGSVTDVENGLDTEDYVSWIKENNILGKGAYGTVYCGLTNHGELIAVKQVPLDMSDQATAEKEYKKLQEEVDLLKTLKHENIVHFLGTSLESNIISIFMEYIPGGSIANLINRFGPLKEKVFCEYTKQILKGVKYLHDNNVVHRDIKGNNIMVMPPDTLKLIDFGCAKRLLCTSKTEAEMGILKSMHGTPYWMAPEVINGTGHGRKSDIWSIGCTVFEMATGKPPLAHMNRMAAMFHIGSHKDLMPSLPDHCSEHARDFVQLCLTSDQRERPSAKQLLQHHFILQQRNAAFRR
ncbi:mitogen-activated protein kinase kinase kinase 19 [Protopterus annectens]|uniref:mitogen-activated protein kinase kinase kinase 19 n=1 Tax=Protopterus annectens TaxID=7888 RepID=UPI001CFAC143|nr:mitogen-activated protein kinase kinase kinase 19 [Protopterus annectens]